VAKLVGNGGFLIRKSQPLGMASRTKIKSSTWMRIGGVGPSNLLFYYYYYCGVFAQARVNQNRKDWVAVRK